VTFAQPRRRVDERLQRLALDDARGFDVPALAAAGSAASEIDQVMAEVVRRRP
jgi:hypothetical protein